ncbi:MAG: O-methyltransferase [Clostridia bacterium]|nr:O-methyltransferase [Clostridia bacterium]
MIDDSINYEYIIRYLRDLLPKREGIQGEMEAFAKAHQVPISQPETMKLLEVLIRVGKVQSVLEVGCAIGYSAICMAQAGCAHIDTIEISPDAARVAQANFAKAGLEERIHLHFGDAREVLPTLTGSYDMIFMDAAKEQYEHFFPHCMRLLKVGGLLVSDNVLYKGMTATDELLQHRKITIVKRLRRYLEQISHMPELETSVLPVGDGVALSYKKTDVAY